ncbi:MAG TPA: glycosyltransferase [Chthonomonadaceae bacterium]|nr:glycosyltransferase [Chthonomonadaceae bacterium]
MRSLLIGGNPGRWNHADPAAPYRTGNGIEAWAYALQGDYWGPDAPTQEVIARYDLVVANLNPWLIPPFVPLAEARAQTTRWVSLIEGSGEDYLDPTPSLRRLLDASDLVAVLNARTTGYFRALTRAPVAWVGLPYPAEAIGAFATPWEARREEVLVCPRVYRGPSFAVAEALGLPVRAYFQKVSRKVKNLPTFLHHGYYQPDLNAHLWRQEKPDAPRIACLEREMEDFWREAGGCRLWANLDPRTTWARYVLDAAALEVPIIATENTDHAPNLFPETTVRDAYCVEEAILLGKRLLGEPEFARRVAREAHARLKRYTPQACLRRLSDALNLSLETIP